MQHPGGVLLPPVQKLVATIISSIPLGVAPMTAFFLVDLKETQPPSHA